jgi:hypothetical protein
LDVIFLLRFEVVMTAVVKMAVFWHVVLYIMIDTDRRAEELTAFFNTLMNRRSLPTTHTVQPHDSHRHDFIGLLRFSWNFEKYTFFLLPTGFMERSPYLKEADGRTSSK